MLRMIADFSTITVAWILAYYLRFHTFLDADKGIPSIIDYLKLLPFIWLTWYAAFRLLGLYRRDVFGRSPLLESFDLVRGSISATILFVAISYFYDEFRYSRATILMFGCIQPLGLITVRSLVRKAMRLYKRRLPPRQVLCVTSREVLTDAQRFCKSSKFEQQNQVTMLLIDSGQAAPESEYEVPPASWTNFLTDRNFEAILVVLPYQSMDFVEQHLPAISQQIANIQIVPLMPRLSTIDSTTRLIDDTVVVSVNENPLSQISAITKRAVDIAGATVGIVVFSPVMITCALLVRLTSPGPVFYRQQRMGLDGCTFEMFKFRSMPITSEDKTGAVWAKKDDQRATPVGRAMRRLSFDELPQLFNVLRGEMSLVGPRPERPVFVSQFRTKIPGYMLRHQVKSGLTGWAQVNGWRGNTSIERRIQYDLYYIQNWSIWFDVKIILLTFLRGFVHPNAY